MKFWAKVRIKGEKNAEHLIRAFFKEFNPKSSLAIKGEDVKVEIFFNDTPPMELIEAINHCDVLEFNFGKALGEFDEDETAQVVRNEEISEYIEQEMLEESNEKVSNQKEQADYEEEKSECTKNVSAESENSEQDEKPKSKARKFKQVNIPELDEFSKKATSFKNFTELVTEWVGLGRNKELFKNILIISTEIDVITWKTLENALQRKEIIYKPTNRVEMSQAVTHGLKDYSVKILQFIDLVRKYKDYPFKKEVVLEESIKKVKMECMPAMPEFEEVLGHIDKTQSIEDRVTYVLTAMGLNNTSVEDKTIIFEFTNTAVRIENMTLEKIFSRINIPQDSEIFAEMVVSKFINNFIKDYNCKVKVLDFLKDLQKVIMLEVEIILE